MKNKITEKDYIKSVKKADREIELEEHCGFKRVTNIHKNKKKYDRRRDRKISPFYFTKSMELSILFFCQNPLYQSFKICFNKFFL